MFKFNNEETRTMSMTCFSVFIVNLLLTSLSTYFTPLSSVFVADFEQVNVCWEALTLCEKLEKIVIKKVFSTVGK